MANLGYTEACRACARVFLGALCGQTFPGTGPTPALLMRLHRGMLEPLPGVTEKGQTSMSASIPPARMSLLGVQLDPVPSSIRRRHHCHPSSIVFLKL